MITEQCADCVMQTQQQRCTQTAVQASTAFASPAPLPQPPFFDCSNFACGWSFSVALARKLLYSSRGSCCLQRRAKRCRICWGMGTRTFWYQNVLIVLISLVGGLFLSRLRANCSTHQEEAAALNGEPRGAVFVGVWAAEHFCAYFEPEFSIAFSRSKMHAKAEFFRGFLS